MCQKTFSTVFLSTNLVIRVQDIKIKRSEIDEDNICIYDKRNIRRDVDGKQTVVVPIEIDQPALITVTPPDELSSTSLSRRPLHFKELNSMTSSPPIPNNALPGHTYWLNIQDNWKEIARKLRLSIFALSVETLALVRHCLHAIQYQDSSLTDYQFADNFVHMTEGILRWRIEDET
ncbi:hypothetical protein K3495_g2152 [Podosphaera aphanis]|nr:hypothetical protein K3495_g2152 [Podosphaera aphanis]